MKQCTERSPGEAGKVPCLAGRAESRFSGIPEAYCIGVKGISCPEWKRIPAVPGEEYLPY